MNSLLGREKQKRLLLGFTVFLLWLPLLFFRFALSPSLTFFFGAVAVIGSLDKDRRPFSFPRPLPKPTGY